MHIVLVYGERLWLTGGSERKPSPRYRQSHPQLACSKMGLERDSEQRGDKQDVEVGQASPSSTVGGALVLRKTITFVEV